jgi:hypothetical protein
MRAQHTTLSRKIDSLSSRSPQSNDSRQACVARKRHPHSLVQSGRHIISAKRLWRDFRQAERRRVHRSRRLAATSVRLCTIAQPTLTAPARGNARISETTSMKVSVIIPAYNRWVVRRAVTSAIGQVNSKIDGKRRLGNSTLDGIQGIAASQSTHALYMEIERRLRFSGSGRTRAVAIEFTQKTTRVCVRHVGTLQAGAQRARGRARAPWPSLPSSSSCPHGFARG